MERYRPKLLQRKQGTMSNLRLLLVSVPMDIVTAYHCHLHLSPALPGAKENHTRTVYTKNTCNLTVTTKTNMRDILISYYKINTQADKSVLIICKDT